MATPLTGDLRHHHRIEFFSITMRSGIAVNSRTVATDGVADLCRGNTHLV
ncbi:MAG: hypothetical protein ACK58L_13140 [Planctomycetota bacterium]